MTIYVDVSAAVHGKAGLKRYAESLVHGMEPLLRDRLALFQNSLGRRGPLPGWENRRVVGVRMGYKPWRGVVWARQKLGWPMDDLLPQAELFHATEHLLPPLKHIPTVLTVHDLIFERFPQYHKRKNYLFLRSAMPMFCRRADAIIAISENTKQDLIDIYDVSPKRIRVIPEAAAPRFRPQSPETIQIVRERYGLPERYALAVGTIEPRKNLSRLADACGPLFEEGLLDGLVLVGSRGWLYEGFFKHLDSLPWKERVILPGFVQDQDLPAIYTGAQVTVQPSLYEGFGLPVLEAMAGGCPVCAARTSSLPEVGGSAAVYFDPESVDNMSETIRRVLMDDELSHRMQQSGLERAACFSWERTARETLALYLELVP